MAHDPKRYLTPEERVVLGVRRHFAVLIPEALLAVGAIVAALLVGTLTSPDEGSTFIDSVFGVIAVAAVVRLGWKVWLWWEDRVFVSDQRIFEVSGVLTRRVASMPLLRVTDLTYERSLYGRILGYGDLIVESAGQDQALKTIRRLPHPDDFYRTITSLVIGRLPSPVPDDETIFTGGPDDPDDTGPLPRITI
ncbi:MAG: PH domain-containing protein [Actinomycetota bacterium]